MSAAEQIPNAVAARRRKGPTPVYMRCEVDANGQGIFRPADIAARNAMRAKKIRVGKVYAVTVKEIRNPGFHRKAHALMTAVIDNVEEFSTYVRRRDEHKVLKRMQLQARLACDEIMIDGGFICFIPMSINFDDMEEAEFEALYNGLIEYIARKYWPGMTREAIEEIAAFASDAD